MIRAILYADDESYRITGYRRLNPVPNKAAERRFLDAAERLFPQGQCPIMLCAYGRLATWIRP
jgi:hypothetical protein